MTTARQRGAEPLRLVFPRSPAPRRPLTPLVVFGLCVLALGLLGEKCFGGPLAPRSVIVNPDDRCVALGSAFPPDLHFVPGAASSRLWVADLSPAQLVPFEVEVVPPEIPDPPGVFLVPSSPTLEDLLIVAEDRALVASGSDEEVLVFDPSTSELVDVTVDGVLRSAIPTRVCVTVSKDSVDSGGAAVEDELCDAAADPDTEVSFYSSGTSGVAITGSPPSRMFVSVSNLGSDADYLPGAVLVFDLDTAPDPPSVTTNSVIVTEGYNPTHVDSVTVDGHDFALVTVSGVAPADGAEVADDPLAAAIEVIDAETLELIARYPLGRTFPSPGGLAIDSAADGRTAVAGRRDTRGLLAVNLMALAGLGSPGAVVSLDTEVRSYETRKRVGGADDATCPPFIAGVAFDDAGSRVFATDFCDGTIPIVTVLPGSPPVFSDETRAAERVAPFDSEDAEAPRGLGAIAVRPGDPSSYTGPDVFVLVAEPEGALCALGVDSV